MFLVYEGIYLSFRLTCLILADLLFLKHLNNNLQLKSSLDAKRKMNAFCGKMKLLSVLEKAKS